MHFNGADLAALMDTTCPYLKDDTIRQMSVNYHPIWVLFNFEAVVITLFMATGGVGGNRCLDFTHVD